MPCRSARAHGLHHKVVIGGCGEVLQALEGSYCPYLCCPLYKNVEGCHVVERLRRCWGRTVFQMNRNDREWFELLMPVDERWMTFKGREEFHPGSGRRQTSGGVGRQKVST